MSVLRQITFQAGGRRGREEGRRSHKHSHLRLRCHVLSATEQFCWSSRRFGALLEGISVVVVVVVVGQKCAFRSLH